MIEIRDLVRIYTVGEVEVRALGRRVDLDREGRVRRDHGTLGLGKVDADAPARLPRPSDVGELRARRHRRRPGWTATARAEIRNAKIGFVFQSFNLLPRTTALENVELPLLYGDNGLSSRASGSSARETPSAGSASRGASITHRAQLSGGQQQRVAIARALITDPPILLADEPTGNLDTRTSEDVLSVFQELNDQGKTVLLITHELDIAASREAEHPLARRQDREGRGHPAGARGPLDRAAGAPHEEQPAADGQHREGGLALDRAEQDALRADDPGHRHRRGVRDRDQRDRQRRRRSRSRPTSTRSARTTS